MKFIYEPLRWLGLILAWPLQLIVFKRKTYYEDKKEQGRFIKGGALVISNHYHMFDYIVNAFLFPFKYSSMFAAAVSTLNVEPGS